MPNKTEQVFFMFAVVAGFLFTLVDEAVKTFLYHNDLIDSGILSRFRNYPLSSDCPKREANAWQPYCLTLKNPKMQYLCQQRKLSHC
ncbi:hypothetical protein [Scytonema hofmannii]|uniref:hypothetical protein n=1 Tax=Scytonema hofmannii TaxID=34078 RepID=UPI00191C7726|nr:hypothetical protein [Scytonema hofmannii]